MAIDFQWSETDPLYQNWLQYAILSESKKVNVIIYILCHQPYKFIEAYWAISILIYLTYQFLSISKVIQKALRNNLTCSSISVGFHPKVRITCPSSTEDILPPPSLQYSFKSYINFIKYVCEIYLSKNEKIAWYSSSFSFDKFAVA